MAIESYEKALNINPDYVDAMNNIGTAYCDLENYIDAVKCYTNAIKINPLYSIYYKNLSVIRPQ